MTTLPAVYAVPRDWPFKRAKFLFTLMKRPAHEGEEVVTAFRDGQVTARSNRRDDGFTFALKEIGYQGIRQGDLVVHAMDAFAGAVGVSESDGKCSPVYSVLRPVERYDARFYAYLLRDLATNGYVASLSRGIRERSTDFRYATLKELELPTPAFDLQRGIADFLDRKTAAIDALIAKKERLIELLEEKRQALITQAVTKGLDPDVPMKDSGIEWLGPIPAHWRVARVKHTMSRIVDCPHSTPVYSDDGEYPAIRTADIERGRLLLSQARRVNAETYRDRVQRMVPRVDDILYSREGERFGMAALVPADVLLCLAQRMMIFRVAPAHDPRFVMWALNSGSTYHQVRTDTVGATSPRINIPTIANAWVALPPRNEQQSIADRLVRMLDGSDRIVSTIVEHIARLQEYRQALITAAVTGKIDVTHA